MLTTHLMKKLPSEYNDPQRTGWNPLFGPNCAPEVLSKPWQSSGDPCGSSSDKAEVCYRTHGLTELIHVAQKRLWQIFELVSTAVLYTVWERALFTKMTMLKVKKQLPGAERFDKRHLPLGWNLLRWGISEGLFPLISGSFMWPFPHGLTLIPSLILQLLWFATLWCDCYPSSGLRLVDLRGGDMATAGMPITRPVSLVTKTAFMWPWCLISYWQHSGGLINMSVMLCRDCWGSTCLSS